MGDIERIIARGNLVRLDLPPARLPAPPTPLRAGPSGLNAHMPPFRSRVDFADEEEPQRPVWPPRRQRLEFDKTDYGQGEDAEPEMQKPPKRARRRVNPFIDAEAGVDGDASNDKEIDEQNNDVDGFIVADDVEF